MPNPGFGLPASFLDAALNPDFVLIFNFILAGLPEFISSYWRPVLRQH
jgi:hypothetical protein